MIVYLNTLAAAGLILLVLAVGTLVSKGQLNSQQISEATESLKNVLEIISNIPRWLQYYNDLKANESRLRDKTDRLQSRLEDLQERVEAEETQTNRTRKNEVTNWLNSAESKCTEVESILIRVRAGSNQVLDFLQRAWLGNKVEKKIQEVDELFAAGVFEQVLLNARPTIELPEQRLVGNAANVNIGTVSRWLRNNEATIIGVHGIRGIGKTVLVMHIHNKLLRDGGAKVYMVTIPEGRARDLSDYELQGKIAYEIGVDLPDEDGPRRPSYLHRVLVNQNFVLIIDGMERCFEPRNIGIPLDATRRKMIITSTSPDVCRRMTSRKNTIKVDPLPNFEALDLFKRELELPSPLKPQIEALATQIVEQCEGVPRKIVEKAKDLKDIDEIDEWQRVFNNMQLDALDN